MEIVKYHRIRESIRELLEEDRTQVVVPGKTPHHGRHDGALWF